MTMTPMGSPQMPMPPMKKEEGIVLPMDHAP